MSELVIDGVVLVKLLWLIFECFVFMGFMYDFAGTVFDARGCGFFGDLFICECCKLVLFVFFVVVFMMFLSVYVF